MSKINISLAPVQARRHIMARCVGSNSTFKGVFTVQFLEPITCEKMSQFTTSKPFFYYFTQLQWFIYKYVLV